MGKQKSFQEESKLLSKKIKNRELFLLVVKALEAHHKADRKKNPVSTRYKMENHYLLNRQELHERINDVLAHQHLKLYGSQLVNLLNCHRATLLMRKPHPSDVVRSKVDLGLLALALGVIDEGESYLGELTDVSAVNGKLVGGLKIGRRNERNTPTI
jgi:hypothetical protein